jgi:hypothetical protein
MVPLPAGRLPADPTDQTESNIRVRSHSPRDRDHPPAQTADCRLAQHGELQGSRRGLIAELGEQDFSGLQNTSLHIRLRQLRHGRRLNTHCPLASRGVLRLSVPRRNSNDKGCPWPRRQGGQLRTRSVHSEFCNDDGLQTASIPQRRRGESNSRTGLCRPLPKPLGHAAEKGTFRALARSTTLFQAGLVPGWQVVPTNPTATLVPSS